MLKYLLEKEFKQILRNKFLSRLIIAMPVMAVALFPFVTNQEVRDVRLCVVDNDRSPASERLAQKVTASGFFLQTETAPSYSKALENIESGQADIILEIPANFERDMKRGESVHVMISANSVNGTRGGLGTQYLTTIINDYGNELCAESGLFAATGAGIPTFTTSVNYRFNPTLDYRTFMVPAMLVVVLTLLCCSLAALNIVGEKEAGTIEQINVTPVRKSVFILAKLIPFWIVGFLSMAFGMVIALLVHGMAPEGSLLTILLFVAPYVLTITGMGMVISNYSDTMQQAMFVMFFFIMILMMTSGLFTPVDSMPELAQTLTTINPMRYFAQVMRLIYLKGSAFAEMLPEFLWLCGLAIALNVWAIASYKKSK